MKLTKATRSRYEAKARMVKALAHPTRLFMVDELGRPACWASSIAFNRFKRRSRRQNGLDAGVDFLRLLLGEIAT
jgi:hypothetical protein